MDPNANLTEQLAMARFLLAQIDQKVKNGETPSEQDYSMENLAELVIAMDEWITKGGFLPDRWRNAERRKA